MTPKTNGKAASAAPKKEATKKPAAPAKADKKADKETDKIEAAREESEPMIDPDELEEQEDAAAAESSSQGGNAAALAAAAGSQTEMSASFKNFRHHPDMENFYRFIYENDLRHEALAIIDEIMVEKQKKKLVKGKPGH